MQLTPNDFQLVSNQAFNSFKKKYEFWFTGDLQTCQLFINENNLTQDQLKLYTNKAGELLVIDTDESSIPDFNF